MKTKREELVTALVHSTGMLSRAMYGGIQAEREVADLARRGEDDRQYLRHQLEREEARSKRAEDRVKELEICYKNATETIQRQADRLSGASNEALLAAVSKERDDALDLCEAAEKAAHRSAERMAAAAEELQKVRPALRPGHGTIQDGVDRALEILTGSDLPPMKEETLLEATRRAASRPVSEAERREHQRTASVRNAQTMRELTTGCPTRTREEP